jgi:hypothetical protein
MRQTPRPNPFAPGDRVRAISMEERYTDRLEIGEIFTVFTSYSGDYVGYFGPDPYIRVKSNGPCFASKCFELVEPGAESHVKRSVLEMVKSARKRNKK